MYRKINYNLFNIVQIWQYWDEGWRNYDPRASDIVEKVYQVHIFFNKKKIKNIYRIILMIKEILMLEL